MLLFDGIAAAGDVFDGDGGTVPGGGSAGITCSIVRIWNVFFRIWNVSRKLA